MGKLEHVDWAIFFKNAEAIPWLNDKLGKFSGKKRISFEAFKQGYEKLITQTMTKLTVIVL